MNREHGHEGMHGQEPMNSEGRIDEKRDMGKRDTSNEGRDAERGKPGSQGDKRR